MASPVWVMARWNKASLNANTRAYGCGQPLTISDFLVVISGTSPDGLASHAMLPDTAIRALNQALAYLYNC
jgi:hypothetical protein